ncbi:MAG: hypothetical protein IJD68_00030 [Ruminococcus sp.]|nr:hypothetical protein [Ruminococcus sp.]
MDLNSLFISFKAKCKTIKKFIRTKKGRNLFLIACAMFVLMFFAPLFQGAVGTALIGCVGIPLVTMIWRRHDFRHAVVPAFFFLIPMVLDMLIYRTLSISVSLLVGIVSTLAVSMHPVFDFLRTQKDDLYAYLGAGGICVCIVVLASLLILLVEIAWWLFCLFLFFAVIAVFFTVVLSSAAYTATDDKRQQRKKQHKKENLDYDSYDFDTFAQDIGLKNELDPHAQKAARFDAPHKRGDKKDPLFYDVD